MKGPTGVGKTEIARRLAKLVKAPFIKVEATKYTEVGYVGRDVESMVRDLVECSIRLVKEEKMKEVAVKAVSAAEKKVVSVLSELKKSERGEMAKEVFDAKLLEELRAGKLDDTTIEIEVVDAPKSMEIVPGGAEISIGSLFGEMLPKKKKRRKMTVKQAMQQLVGEESEKLIDNDSVNAEALRRAEEQGIIFIDEIDKIAGKENRGGADVSREGVQRDILPIVEGCTVMTKYGPVKTDFILFIAAGAFHLSKVEDLIPELQGRFPHQRRAGELVEGRLRQDPHPAAKRDHVAVRQTARGGQHRPALHRRRHRRDRADLRRHERHQRGYRRPPPAHRHGIFVGRYFLQRRRRLPDRHRDHRQKVRRRAPRQGHQRPGSEEICLVTHTFSFELSKEKVVIGGETRTVFPSSPHI